MELPKISNTTYAIGGAAALGVAALGTAAIIHHRRKKKKKTTHSKSTRKKVHSRVRGRRRRSTPRTAGKRKDTSHRRIRYTKKGQPYIITASGKAKFIKKSSAKKSHKRKGGRY